MRYLLQAWYLGMQVPWANLGKSAVVVHIDQLYILAGPKVEAEAGDEESYEVYFLLHITKHSTY